MKASRMILNQSRLLRLSTDSKCGTSALRCAMRSLSSSMEPRNSELKGSESPNRKSTTKEGRVKLKLPKQNSAAVHHADIETQHQRVWLPSSADEPLFWNEDVVKRNTENPQNLSRLLERIEKQELEGGRYRMKQYGVLHEDPAEDMVSV